MLRPTTAIPLNQVSDSTKPRTRASFLRRRRTGGFTLLEVLIATAVTLLMMVSLAQIFKVIGDSMKQGRAALELNNRLRSVTYRVRLDLENATINPNPPADPASGEGYLKYYDGPATDYAFANANPAASRFGDVDDILMFTARAGDVWFTGKVPLFVLEGRNPTNDDLDGNGLNDDLENKVTIAAQHAEIAMFMEPIVSSDGNPGRDTSFLVENPAFFQDNDGVDGNGDGFPDGYRLHYRTLLIRPDLNLPSGHLGGLAVTPTQGIFTAGSETVNTPTTSGVALPSPLCDMYRVHGSCDLSMRRVFSTADGLGSRDFVAANSLEDLVDPANRFAHVQVTLPDTSGGISMPLLALGPSLNIDGGNGPIGINVSDGFLHPAYTLLGSRIGEDILASDILAFDVKAFDGGVSLVGTAGIDGIQGTPQDDDGDGDPNNPAELGWAGSDDLVLSPNDPGYAAALAAIGGTSRVVGTGEYVDLAWASKMINTITGAPTAGTFLETQFSGSNAAGGFTNSLFKSGQAFRRSSGALFLFQPSYDTWTTRYEGDGILQAEVLSTRGVVRVTAAPTLRENWRNNFGNFIIDAGTDGIDNNSVSVAGSGVDVISPGVDDVSELETSPPFPVKLRGLKVSIRMEDPATRQIKQMSVAKEFVTQ